MENKKVRERILLDEVAQVYSAFPAGKIIETESPDFLIEQESKTIGIEIVDFIRGQNKGTSPDRQNEVLRQTIANTAKKTFEAKYNIPLLVYVHWNPHHLLRLSEISDLANLVFQIVEENIPGTVFGSTRVNWEKLYGTKLEKICYSMTIIRVRNEKQSLWSFISSGRIGVQTDELKYLIESKNNKAPKYLKQCDVVWLLVIADGGYMSSNIDLSESTLGEVYSCSFEKVLVYDRFIKAVFLLKTRREQS